MVSIARIETSRISEVSSGKIPTSVLRAISRLKRLTGFVERIFGHCSVGKAPNASTPRLCLIERRGDLR